ENNAPSSIDLAARVERGVLTAEREHRDAAPSPGHERPQRGPCHVEEPRRPCHPVLSDESVERGHLALREFLHPDAVLHRGAAFAMLLASAAQSDYGRNFRASTTFF